MWGDGCLLSTTRLGSGEWPTVRAELDAGPKTHLGVERLLSCNLSNWLTGMTIVLIRWDFNQYHLYPNCLLVHPTHLGGQGHVRRAHWPFRPSLVPKGPIAQKTPRLLALCRPELGLCSSYLCVLLAELLQVLGTRRGPSLHFSKTSLVCGSKYSYVHGDASSHFRSRMLQLNANAPETHVPYRRGYGGIVGENRGL